MNQEPNFAPNPQHLRECIDYIGACQRWIRLHPELAAEANVRFLLDAYPEEAGHPSGEGSAGDSGVTDCKETGEDRGEMAEKYERQSRSFDAALSAITDFFYIFDLDGRFLYANNSLLRLWGRTRQEAVGKNFFDLDYPDALASKLQRQIQQVIETRERLSDETAYTSPAGVGGYYEYIFSPVIAADGTVEAVAGSTRDITQRKRRELNLAFLAEIQKALAPLSSAADILRAAGERIAERLHLTRCLLVEINETADEATVLVDHCAEGEPSLVGAYRIADFHTEDERREMAGGGTMVINDVRALPRPAENAARFADLGIASLANASYVADGRWKFVLSAQKGEPYAWTSEDTELLSELAARIYPRLERARVEERLRESEERFRGTFENAAIGIAHVGLDGRWLRTNQALCNITGYSCEELAAKTFSDLTHPDDLDAGLALVRRVLSGEISTFSVEKRYLRKDGSHLWANLTVSLLRDPAGQPLHFISAIEDITEKKAASAELERQRRFVERLTHVMPSALYVFDLAERRNIWVNREIGATIGYSMEEISGMGSEFSERTMHPEDFVAIPAHFEKLATLADGEALEIEYRFRHRNGEWRWFCSRDTPFSRGADGRVREIVGTATDVTERRGIEAALKAAKETAETANQSKDRFLAILSHELRTPLSPVLMTATELRGDENLPGEVREQLGMIERNIALEARLIDDLLDITRIINGKLAVRAEPCDAHSLIGLVVEMIRSDAQEKRIAIHLDLAARHSQITGDPARLQQVFWNLLRNAVKFSPEGGNVRIRSLDPPCIGDMEVESRVCIEVSDDGVGFEADAATVIFQPFEQGASGHRFGGLGLGLAIARAIVDIHGGTVRAKSPGPGQGATFTVELPGATRPLAAATRLSGGENPGRGSGLERDAPMRLLLVEDHEPTMQVLTRLLTRAGHHTVAAQSLAEARAAAAKETFDAVISDLGLPDGTGVELMQNLKAAHGLRGIALSGYGTDEDLRRSEAAGFVVHLVKPVDFNDLRRALREFVRARP